MGDQPSDETDQTAVEYEIHFSVGYGWHSMNQVIAASDPAPSIDEARRMVARFEAIGAVDDYYKDAEVRVVRVTRTVIPPVPSTPEEA